MYTTIFIAMVCFIDIKLVFANHSTVYQFLKTYHNIVQSFDEGKSCCMIFCDVSKAFDRVWHNGLIFKLQTYCVSSNFFHSGSKVT